jgi:5'-3' exonuclease/transcription antitermination factor NusG
MTDRWLILELSPRSEGEDPDIIRQSISGILKGAEVFIPAAITQVGDDRVVHYLVDGYAFVRQDRKENDFRRLENSRYVQTILINPANHTMATVSDVEIERMRSKVLAEADQGIGVGDIVIITAGPYKEITASVIEDFPETQKVQVHVKLRSKESIVTLPRSFLRVVTRLERSPQEERARRLRDWLRVALVVSEWGLRSSDCMVRAMSTLQQIELWRGQGAQLFDFIQAFNTPLHSDPLVDSWRRWMWVSRRVEYGSALWDLIEVLEAPDPTVPKSLIKAVLHWHHLWSWQQEAARLFDFIQAYNITLSPAKLKREFARWSALTSQINRVTALSSDIADLQTQLSREESGMVDNVIIDGFNLAFRCRFAPGIADLHDSKGRPTGLIFGFVRSLAAMKKRFQTARIHVCWDGSSGRRKAVFSGYKANRPERATENFDQIGFLRGLLPLMGVNQAWNPQEEADDVIATLTRKDFSAQRNLIVTTDRDMLQLVTGTTVVLIPESGGRKEILFDEDRVLQEYGVEPARMPQLRAMVGDTSDNIPGVARVPSKILSGLVRSYGTVDKVFSSGLPGLTKSQYTKLREAEEQIRLNVDLMTLQDVPLTRIDPNPDQTAASMRLQDVEVKPDVIEPLYGSPQGFLKGI